MNNDGQHHMVNLNSNDEPKLNWMVNPDESRIVWFSFPLHIELQLENVPLYKMIIYFNTEELVEVSFKTNPAHPINVQHKFACLCAERVISDICDAVGWQEIMNEFYLHCAAVSNMDGKPELAMIQKFEQKRMNIFGQVSQWMNDFDS